MDEFNSNYLFVENEKEILRNWEETHIFDKLKTKNSGGKKYRFIDGPITANNPMGIHHAWGRTLKDTFLRYKAMNGYESHYRNGFDGQGLWVEVEVERELGFKTKKDIENYGIAKFADKCIERVEKCAKIITGQSKRLGQWMDWDNSYYTYKDSNITGIWHFLRECHNHDWIKKIKRPMPWCPRCGTSLSEHEMSGSYKEITHEAVFVKLPVPSLDACILVWTTTPWTLSANVALAVNPALNYVAVKIENEDLPVIMGENYYKIKFEGKAEILRMYKGSELAGTDYETCFPLLPLQSEIDHKIVPWEDVLDDEGSGVVHIAPGCGAEDFELGKKEGLPIIVPINESGIFYDNFGFLSGKHSQNIKDEIFEELKKQKKLFYTHKYKHSYPVCWRCKEEILFRLVNEWAISVDELRPRLIENAQKVKWNPPYQGKRMEDWLVNMGDWCISRTRYYGLPLPFYPCECGKLTVIGSIDELRENAVEKELVEKMPHIHRPWIDGIHIICPDCGKEVSRIPQVGDVWLDAGIVPFSTLKYFEDKNYWNEYFPAEFVIEMKEQIRLWFYSMLFMSTVLINEPPYEQVGTHGTVTAEDGSRFSKTGNMIRFDEAADKIGADASRYLYASSPMTGDVRFGFNLGDDVKKKLLNYWNLYTFFMTYARYDNPDINSDLKLNAGMNATDKWIIIRTNRFIKETTDFMENYDTRNVIQKFEAIVDEISNFYIRVNRRRFWKDDCGDDKNDAYNVLYYAIKSITQVMAPIIPFLTECIWINMIVKYGKNCEESVHLSEWPKSTAAFDGDENASVLDDVQNARNIIALILRLRNEKQIKIRQKLSHAYIYVSENKMNVKLSPEFEQIVLNESNIGGIKYISDKKEVEDNIVKLNFKLAGSVLKSEVNKVNKIVGELTDDETNIIAKEVQSGNMINLPGYEAELQSDLFILESKPKENLLIAEEAGIFLALDTLITEELRLDGILRDILRQCQICRKNAGFEINDRITVDFKVSDKIRELIKGNEQFVGSELLAVIKNIDGTSYSETFNVGEEEITIKMKKL